MGCSNRASQGKEQIMSVQGSFWLVPHLLKPYSHAKVALVLERFQERKMGVNKALQHAHGDRREPSAWPTRNLVPLASAFLTHPLLLCAGGNTEPLKIKLIIILWRRSTLTIIALGIFQKSHDVVGVTSWRRLCDAFNMPGLLQNVRRQKRERDSSNWSQKNFLWV